MSQFERGLGLNMLFLERVCMACCGGGSTGVGSRSSEGTCIEEDKIVLVGEEDEEVEGRGVS